MTAKRKNVEQGYWDDFGFHPIRASKDYNEFQTTDVESKKERSRRRAAADERRLDLYNEGRIRKYEPRYQKSLSQFVRAHGGMRAGKSGLEGELRRLSRKESGTTGLVSESAEYTPEYMMKVARSHGYKVPSHPGDFLAAVESDARGLKKVYSMENPGKRKLKGAPLFDMFAHEAAKSMSGGKRKVKRSDTGLEGKVLSQKGDWFKVQYDGYDRPHYSHRDDLIFMNPKSNKVMLRKNGRRYTAIPKSSAKKNPKRATKAAPKRASSAKKAAKNPTAQQHRNKRMSEARKASVSSFRRRSSPTAARNIFDSYTEKLRKVKKPTKRQILKARRLGVIAGLSAGVIERQVEAALSYRRSNPTKRSVAKKKNPLASAIKTVRAAVKRNPPLLSDIIGGLAGGAGYAAASHTVNHILNRRRKNKAAKKNPAKRSAAKRAAVPRQIANVHRRFQGRAVGVAHAISASQHVPASVAQLGQLHSIRVNGKLITGFSPKARLCADGRNKLHIVGARFKKPVEISNPNELALIGKMTEVSYMTGKEHIGNGKQFIYVHKMGEDGGRPPDFHLDTQGFPVIRGGTYKIQRRGIVQ